MEKIGGHKSLNARGRHPDTSTLSIFLVEAYRSPPEAYHEAYRLILRRVSPSASFERLTPGFWQPPAYHLPPPASARARGWPNPGALQDFGAHGINGSP